MTRLSLDKEQLKVVLLEGIHPNASEIFKREGYHNITTLSGSLPPKDLVKTLKDARFVGIRSRTQLTPEILRQLPKLAGIGCFCIGTNQIALDAAQLMGIPVFNAPFSNTRSVAELVLGEILLLMRGIPKQNMLTHRGIWDKTARNAVEARGKTLGIIGYGHIGTQLGVMAENIGMKVCYYDIQNKLSLGNATQISYLNQLLAISDVVSLHVPETELTHQMIGARELSRMKPGSILINAARGHVVDIDALAEALRAEHIGGAAIDVYPQEPKANGDPFDCPLQEFDNVILTPHIGGSTQEAQKNIGTEVAEKLTRYSDNGTTLSAVNFPEVTLPPHNDACRLLHIHHNRPGVLTAMNHVFADSGINIAAQYLQTNADIGYVVTDVETENGEQLLTQLKQIEGTIRARILY
uniref:phosphoglycerate dehydrogenase n=1 Tax=Dongshaea marina TaxID=2047966 RepID=UPI000D3E1EDA|nr:phosphoglycerate dehydrogenase [Dongshaea marina]